MEDRFPFYCPYQGENCKRKKHCIVVVLAEPPRENLRIRVQCPVIKAETGGAEKEIIVLITAA